MKFVLQIFVHGVSPYIRTSNFKGEEEYLINILWAFKEEPGEIFL